MVSLLEDFPQIRLTFNLTPSLIEQLLDYAQGPEADDLYLYYTLVPAAELDQEGRTFVLKNFFKANHNTMIRPLPRYQSLLQKRDDGRGQARDRFSVQDLLDLQVLFNLVWFGFRARERYPEIADLLRKGRGFTESDKEVVISIQRQILRELLSHYKVLNQSGQIELTTSPYYHPILPLLWDSTLARRALPNLKLPRPFRYPEDVEAQVNRATALHRRVFGFKPQGMWPSEGAVCPEIIPTIAEAGIEWMATDEGILWQSLTGKVERELLYRPYRVQVGDRGVTVVFRDRVLSDLIGFTYHQRPPVEAAEDLCNRLLQIRGSCPHPLVAIILDGENPWEYYPDGGRGFLLELYRRLSMEKMIETVRMSDYLESHPPSAVLRNIASGSWINSNYEIWIGCQETNQAWEYLSITRQWLQDQARSKAYPRGSLDAAREAIYIAEGSDWFWWYGPQFSNPDKNIFDELYRKNLMAVYKALDREVPYFLQHPIFQPGLEEQLVMPLGSISPTIDGQITHFYEWHEAGYYRLNAGQGAMVLSDLLLSSLYFGYDQERFYIRLDPTLVAERKETKDWKIHIEFQRPIERTLIIPYNKGAYQGMIAAGGRPAYVSQIAYQKIIELEIPWSVLGGSGGKTIEFSLAIREGSLELIRYPREGLIKLPIPEIPLDSTMWVV